MNPQLQNKIDNTFHTLQQLMVRPFPETRAEPYDNCSWELWQNLLADTPSRLVEVIANDYHDCITYEEDEDDKPCDELFYEYDDSYKAIYQQCIEKIAVEWGQGKVVKSTDIRAYFYRSTNVSYMFPASSPTFFETTPAVLLNPARLLYSEWRMELTYWIIEDRVAFVHYAGDKGDGDFQFVVSIAVVPLHVPDEEDEE